jgi:signal transduction histidine kinase
VLQEQHLGLDRYHVKETELKKETERLEEVIKQLNETLQEEQESYARTIAHMRQSIMQDEKAIESLVKQASSL